MPNHHLIISVSYNHIHYLHCNRGKNNLYHFPKPQRIPLFWHLLIGYASALNDGINVDLTVAVSIFYNAHSYHSGLIRRETLSMLNVSSFLRYLSLKWKNLVEQEASSLEAMPPSIHPAIYVQYLSLFWTPICTRTFICTLCALFLFCYSIVILNARTADG